MIEKNWKEDGKNQITIPRVSTFVLSCTGRADCSDFRKSSTGVLSSWVETGNCWSFGLGQHLIPLTDSEILYKSWGELVFDITPRILIDVGWLVLECACLLTPITAALNTCIINSFIILTFRKISLDLCK